MLNVESVILPLKSPDSYIQVFFGYHHLDGHRYIKLNKPQTKPIPCSSSYKSILMNNILNHLIVETKKVNPISFLPAYPAGHKPYRFYLSNISGILPSFHLTAAAIIIYLNNYQILTTGYPNSSPSLPPH